MQTGKVAVEPADTTAKHRVIMRVSTVPLLPRSRCTLLNPPAKSRKISLIDNLIRKLLKTIVTQNLEQVTRTHYSRVKMVVNLGNICPQRLYNLCPAFSRNAHLQRKHITAILAI